MKKLINKLFIFTIYCVGYVSIINVSASAINNSIETLTLTEIFSVQAMKSGQKDVFTFLKLQIEGIDVEKMREEIVNELEKI